MLIEGWENKPWWIEEMKNMLPCLNCEEPILIDASACPYCGAISGRVQYLKNIRRELGCSLEDAKLELKRRCTESTSRGTGRELSGIEDTVERARELDPWRSRGLVISLESVSEDLLDPVWRDLLNSQREYEDRKNLWDQNLERLGRISGRLEHSMASGDPSLIEDLLELANATSITDAKVGEIQTLYSAYREQLSKNCPPPKWDGVSGIPNSVAFKNAAKKAVDSAFVWFVPVVVVAFVLKLSVELPFTAGLFFLLASAIAWPFYKWWSYSDENSSYQHCLQQRDRHRTAALAELTKTVKGLLEEIHVRIAERLGTLARQKEERERDLVGQYHGVVGRLGTEIDGLIMENPYAFEDWSSPLWRDWSASTHSRGFVRVGCMAVSANGAVFERTFKNLFFNLKIPYAIGFPTGRPLLMQVGGRGVEVAIGAAQALVARILATHSPGMVRFTFIDPVGLGQNAAQFLPLGDYAEELVGTRAWSEPQHIDKRLAELTEHVENVIQKYLRHEFNTVDDYNRNADEIAEAYRVLVVFDFPVNFTEASARRLVSLMQNGPRCGVYPIVVSDVSKSLPHGFVMEHLEQSASVVEFKDGRFSLSEHASRREEPEHFTLQFDPPCPPELLSRIIREVGGAAKGAATVEVPYAKVLASAGLDPAGPDRWWRDGDGVGAAECSSAGSVEIPLGPAGARKTQVLMLGKGTAHHVLIAGRTGSGKSNLLHVIITTLAVKYSPREVELYLIDFKKGVEFKPYANYALPHARVIAIESEREFGLSVLQGLDTEMQRRGEVFRGMEANDLAEYRQKTDDPLARLILIVDEFQEFFSEDDAIGRQAAGILDRLVRQGRSFGIHVVLGSQSLAGSYSLARSTLDQMQIRIALPCSEADSRLILADDNPAARLLSRPGEAIYNAESGLVEGNQIFQVAHFSDDDRQYYLQALARKGDGLRRPIVFEGHEPAALEACVPLTALLAAPGWPVAGKGSEVWLGEAVAMKPPTSVRFRRQGGANLLVLTREEEQGVGLLAACVLGLAAQHHPDSVRFYLVDFATADAPWADHAGDMADLLPHRIEVLGRRDLPGLLTELTAEIVRRNEDHASAKAWGGYLIIQGLHRARDLRPDPSRGYGFGEEDKANPAEQFAAILREGPEVGIHTLVWCDTYLNLERTLEGRALREFGHRVAGSMSQDDSMRLLDDAAAARIDRPHRLIKYDEDQVGVLEKFRPYRIPATTWLEQTAEALRQRVS